jgi:hypothetical protein
VDRRLTDCRLTLKWFLKQSFKERPFGSSLSKDPIMKFNSHLEQLARQMSYVVELGKNHDAWAHFGFKGVYDCTDWMQWMVSHPCLELDGTYSRSDLLWEAHRFVVCTESPWRTFFYEVSDNQFCKCTIESVVSDAGDTPKDSANILQEADKEMIEIEMGEVEKYTDDFD